MRFKDNPDVIPRMTLRPAPGAQKSTPQIANERRMEDHSAAALQRDQDGSTANARDSKHIPWFVKRRMKKRKNKYQQ